MAEYRQLSIGCGPIEVREDGEGAATISGYGAVFYDAADPAGTEFSLWAGVVERLAPTAFDDTLRGSDNVRALFNHNPDLILGSTAAGTMSLRTDKKGLRYEIPVADTTIAKDVAENIRRGDITGSSIGFRVVTEEWDDSNEDGPEVRTIKAVALFDTGPVTFPAYSGTSSGVRSDGDLVGAEASHSEWKRSRRLAAAQQIDRRNKIDKRMKIIDAGLSVR